MGLHRGTNRYIVPNSGTYRFFTGTMLRADSFFSFAVVVLQFRMTGGTHYVVLLVGCSGLILRTPSIRLCVLSERDKGARPFYSLQYVFLICTCPRLIYGTAWMPMQHHCSL